MDLLRLGHIYNSFLVQEHYTDHVSYVENMTTDDIEDTLLVNAVLSDMMDKQYVKHVDLGMKPLVKKVKDPTHRMNYRHQKVPIVTFVFFFCIFFLFRVPQERGASYLVETIVVKD